MRKLSLDDLNRLDVDGFKQRKKVPLVLVLDNIRSALNVGSAFRTADAFALNHIYLCGITAKPPHREILKTAIGASDSMNWTHTTTTKEALETLKSQGFTLIAIEQTNESVLLETFEMKADKKYAFILGNEVKGVSKEALNLVDHCLEISQFGTKHSLNVSVCTGIIVWEYMRQVGLKLL